MELPLGVQIECTDGPYGHATHWILNPLSLELTYVVLACPETPPRKVLVPFEWIERSLPDRISLRCTASEARGLSSFGDVEHVELPSPLTQADARCCCRECRSPNESPAYLTQMDMATWSRVRPHPLSVAPRRYAAEVLSHLPQGEIALQNGAEVRAIDGRVGRVDEIVVDLDDHTITHFVIREQLSLTGQEIAIPVSAVDRVFTRAIHLSLDRQAVEALPEIPITRIGS